MPSDTDLSQLSVMVIDDNEIMLEMMAMALQRLDLKRVIKCLGGQEAMSQIEAKSAFDIVLLDLNMPEINGVDILRALAAHQYSGGILLFSGEHEEALSTAASLAEECQLNLLGVLQKPTPIDQLQSQLKTFIKQ